MEKLSKRVPLFTYLSVSSILISIAASESFLALAFLLWLPIGISESVRERRIALQWPPFFGAVRFFVAASILSVLFSSDPHAGFRALKKIPLFFLCFLVVRFFDSTWVRRTFLTLFGVASISGLVAGIQFFQKWIRFRQTGMGADDPTLIFRVHGFMGHWMTFSGEQVLMLACVLAFVVLYPIRRMWAWIPVILVLTASVFLSFTRSVWLASAVVVAVVLLRYRKKVLLTIPVVMLLLVLVMPTAVGGRLRSFVDLQFASNQGRIEMARAGWRMFCKHPWFGVGPSRIKPEFAQILKEQGKENVPYFIGHLHNNFFQLAAERGIFALFAFSWLLVELLVRFWRGSRRTGESPEWRAVCLAGLLSTVALIVAGMFEFNFGDSEVLILFLFIITAPYAAHASKTSASTPSST